MKALAVLYVILYLWVFRQPLITPPGRSNELGAIFDYRIQATTHYPPAGLPDPLLPELLGCCPCCGCCA